MFSRSREVDCINHRWNTPYTKLIDVYICDECGNEFDRPHSTIPNTNLTFCSRECNKKTRSTGTLAKLWKEIKLELYGVEYSSQVSGSAEKMIETRKEKYGTSAPIHYDPDISAKWKHTMCEKYGVDHPSKNDEIKEKKRQTYQIRYGVNCPFSSGSIFRDEGACVRGGQAGYRALIKKLGVDGLSKPEKDVALLLFDYYGQSNVKQQIILDHGGCKPWLIDFYIIPIDIYVEVDGMFWHGLDVPYDQLHPNQQKKFNDDRYQDEWFKLHNKCLIRITEDEVNMCRSLNDWSSIISKFGG